MSKIEKVVIGALFALGVLIVVYSSYYRFSRHTGDTALFGEIVETIYETGKAESNIFANTQDQIDKMIGAIPLEDRLSSNEAFQPPEKQSRNMLGFHFYLILYLLAPFCRFASGYTILTVAQAIAEVSAILLCYLITRNGSNSILTSLLTVGLVVAHPGWSLPASFGSFYPDRLFLLSGMFLAYCLERKKSPFAIALATLLCMLVGERGALFAGMFILAVTILYWKDQGDYKIVKISIGLASVVYAGFVTKYVLDNTYYSSGILGVIRNFNYLLSLEYFQKQIILFCIINFAIFALICVFDWRAAVIGICSTIPNIMFSVGGAEKIEWSLHYHVYYFVILIWAVCKGSVALSNRLKVNNIKYLFYIAWMITATVLLATISPKDIDISFSLKNVNNNFAVRVLSEIGTPHLSQKSVLKDYDKLIDGIVTSDDSVSVIEQAMCEVNADKVYLYPIGIDIADYAIMSYFYEDNVVKYTGAVSYLQHDDTVLLNEYVIEKMKRIGYNFESAIYYEPLGIVVVHNDGKYDE